MSKFNFLSALINLISLVFFVVLTSFTYLIFTPSPEKIALPEKKAFCGVVLDNLTSDLADGKTLFRKNCATCHNRNMVNDLTGPALGKSLEAWSGYPKEDLYAFIRNSQQMIKDGHPRAIQSWEDWKPSIMNSFENLQDQEIEAILEYVTMIANQNR